MTDMDVAYWMLAYDNLRVAYDQLKEDYADLNCHYAAALDKITELENPWVSVEDRLPEEGVNVLTYGARPFYDCFYINRIIDKDEWLYDDVIYWMPLPDYPNHQRRMQNEIN